MQLQETGIDFSVVRACPLLDDRASCLVFDLSRPMFKVLTFGSS